MTGCRLDLLVEGGVSVGDEFRTLPSAKILQKTQRYVLNSM